MANAVATVAITPSVGQSTRRNWSFTTRFTPKGPDRFYLYARPEQHTEDPSFIYSSFKTEDITDDVEMVSLDTTDFDVKMMQYVTHLLIHLDSVEHLIGSHPYLRCTISPSCMMG